ncbi:hypothetical protein [Acidovorax sp. Root217]|uniref:hypothetical protein n=1 Tax=Acidovorax sp. Root217 TaxID=1736492 RepID=UPI000A4D239D|nr:hypothetical protein [Acidovorax sp. Root217]
MGYEDYAALFPVIPHAIAKEASFSHLMNKVIDDANANIHTTTGDGFATSRTTQTTILWQVGRSGHWEMRPTMQRAYGSA